MSDELHPAKSGISAAIVNQPFVRDDLPTVSADLIFTLHLMITVIAYTIVYCPLRGKATVAITRYTVKHRARGVADR